jgi:hypothetical protein
VRISLLHALTHYTLLNFRDCSNIPISQMQQRYQQIFNWLTITSATFYWKLIGFSIKVKQPTTDTTVKRILALMDVKPGFH